MRPFVFRIAREEQLEGFVLNDAEGVLVEIFGPTPALERFTLRLQAELPPLARIDALEVQPIPPGDAPAEGSGFDIRSSQRAGPASVGVTVDAATCDACLRELRDPDDRRHRHPLINCTQCGPRFSLVTRVPYDRPNTTMAEFPMCAACRTEYEDPRERRHHAQPICCLDCGPQLSLHRGGRMLPSDQALPAVVELLAEGGIAVIKGLGGFHLAGRADHPEAVARIRALKRRDHKPFAVMVATPEQALRYVTLSGPGQAELTSVRRPIVLAPLRASPAALVPDVVGRTHRLGVVLPYTPIHHLLFGDPRLAERPLVMTSANLSEAPMIFADEQVLDAFAPEVDAVLTHPRAIARRLDDGIVVDTGQDPLPVRRARGHVPSPLRLPSPGPPGIAVGGDLKNTFAVARGDEAILSAHHGDLVHRPAREAFEAETERFLDFFEVEPAFVACDLHPDFASRRHAERLSERLGVPLVEVQHHHAHAASLLAEAGGEGPILVAVLDGFGYAPDGSTWGGELLVADPAGFERVGSLVPVLAVGGDRYAREPARPALAWLSRALGEDAEVHSAAARLVPDPNRRRQLVELGPRFGGVSTSAGRLFDAAAALLGLAPATLGFEAEAAMALEAAASRGAPDPSAPTVEIIEQDGLSRLDPGRLMVWLAESAPSAEVGAASFHHRLALGFAEAAAGAADRAGVTRVGLSGGVAVNQAFASVFAERLGARGLEVLAHRLVPPNDGGLALGQLTVARARLADRPRPPAPTGPSPPPR